MFEVTLSNKSLVWYLYSYLFYFVFFFRCSFIYLFSFLLFRFFISIYFSLLTLNIFKSKHFYKSVFEIQISHFTTSFVWSYLFNTTIFSLKEWNMTVWSKITWIDLSSLDASWFIWTIICHIPLLIFFFLTTVVVFVPSPNLVSPTRLRSRIRITINISVGRVSDSWWFLSFGYTSILYHYEFSSYECIALKVCLVWKSLRRDREERGIREMWHFCLITREREKKDLKWVGPTPFLLLY